MVEALAELLARDVDHDLRVAPLADERRAVKLTCGDVLRDATRRDREQPGEF
jgi:hypothetical protein